MIRTKLNQTKRLINTLITKHKKKPYSVNLLAVSKTFPKEAVLEAYKAGQTDFGENYLQDALTKIKSINHSDINWHFIGSIQSNKTKEISENFDWIHTIDREKVAKRLNKQRPDNKLPLNCFIQVNVSEDKNKNGLTNFDEILKLAHTIESLPNLNLKGLMAIPKQFKSYKKQLAEFKKLSDMLTCLKKVFPKIDDLSIGMTQDIEAAIAAGSTWVRIGTGIFGNRS